MHTKNIKKLSKFNNNGIVAASILAVTSILLLSAFMFQYTYGEGKTGCSNCVAPSIRGDTFLGLDNGFTIQGHGYKITSKTNPISTEPVEVGKNVQIKLFVYEDLKPSNIVHVGLYMNLHGIQEVDSSDTYIVYERNVAVKVVDPHGFFANVTVTPEIKKVNNPTLSVQNRDALELTYDITFAKPMQKSNIMVTLWDFQLNVETDRMSDALEVVAAGTLPPLPQPMVEPMKEKEIASPVAQLKSGVEPQNVECKVGLQKAMKPSSDIPVCVKPATLKILLQRGWR
ncbi:MAG: hypothetical protein HY295_07555 [Thaumarchaeota archaeon]|nr:hypothetical protein [Nitrososphaerota archaeon]